MNNQKHRNNGNKSKQPPDSALPELWRRTGIRYCETAVRVRPLRLCHRDGATESRVPKLAHLAAKQRPQRDGTRQDVLVSGLWCADHRSRRGSGGAMSVLSELSDRRQLLQYRHA